MSKTGTKDNVSRRSFLKAGAAATGGLAFVKWAVTNFDAAAQEGQRYVIVSDVLRGGGGERKGPGCVENSVFQGGEEIVWRAVVFDGQTGQLINGLDEVSGLGLKMTVTVDGIDQVFEMAHGVHPRNADPADQINYWSESWVVPPDVSGKFKYSITVEDSSGGKGALQFLGIPGVDTFPSALSLNETLE